ncbi:hypothetical protein TSUD_296490 [Trifolium subterraneum]|uniref:SWIM-type domain-containing protein n=1 Tax=Trifolium subterraneum TaxID=3900 RepID=A0A2Z6MUC7_TRISU|nr:hypothetical protein TSUD_296490 [Trifolium subterraneum]
MPSSSANLPSESTHNIDLNIPNDVAPISVVAGVHRDEVGDFSENEDDIIAQHVDNVDDNEDQENFMRTFKNADMKNIVTNMGYSMNQPSIAYYRSQIRDWSEDAVKWVDDIPKEQWLQAHDEGRRWGHMTTNLAKCINNVLKGTRNLPICSLVQATYYRSSELFVKRGRQVQAMMASGLIYSEKVMENLAKERIASNTHQVYIHNRAQSIFSVKELVRPTSGRPRGTFKVDLDKQWCDCGEFQALHCWNKMSFIYKTP